MSNFQTGGASRTIQDASDKLQDAIDESAVEAVNKVSDLADRASELVSKVGERAQDAYSRTAERARDAADIIDPFVQERPYVALVIAAGIGVVVGLLMAGRGPKIIYVDGHRA
jgi:ElaB/YqjD/DUF883 family membrane-anchored ribosome-binding protein